MTAPPDAADSSDGTHATAVRSGVYRWPRGAEDSVRSDETSGAEDLPHPEESGGTAQTTATEDVLPLEEPGDVDESTGTAAAGPGASVAPAPASDEESRERLVAEPLRYQSRWEDIQAGFVDEPRRSVADADALVADVIDEITAAFASARAELAAQRSPDDEASTEDLRQALRRYRSFFQRLVSI